ncbi:MULTISPECIES: invasion associated locus B family protein [unclassified Salipiger]|uniref:invasion associated locus B family protein n=1 Tax=unclassified Salipiger TaxID=2640570 RepID=UPI0013B9C301|nr:MULTISPECIES: invasion associated locus B family protein [unclassified Salipiger]NDV51739.1 invasion associated locus B family protein [Salipiger sp. PrR003]NDW31981.1 invasion associated locus B family protein [Salipiger sp. PrR007]
MIRPLHILRLLPLAAALATMPAYAQDAAQTNDAPAADQAEGTVAAGGLSLGEDANAETPGAPGQQPETYVKATHGSWELQCLRAPEGSDAEDPCQMYQLLQDSDGNNVAEVSLFRVANGGQVAAGGTFVVPLETLLTQKLTISVDGGQAKRYDFSFCTPVGCYARVGFTEEDVNRFKAGKGAQITIVPALAPDQKVTLDMSLSGFTAGYEETSALRQ